ncbi:MAG: DNA oxidative demethylase AlkB [Kordiimonas sp.]
MKDLFEGLRPSVEHVAEGIVLFPQHVDTVPLLAEIDKIAKQSPFRHMQTPGGRRMSVAMTNCGRYGWTSGKSGYQYSSTDPLSGAQWPSLPASFQSLAHSAAAKAGFNDFIPDSCLINWYEPGTKLTPHQDRDEADMRWPIVSVSLGISAMFQFFGNERGGQAKNLLLQDGDVLVWGGRARLYYHGVKKLEKATDDRIGALRYNLTFRKAIG